MRSNIWMSLTLWMMVAYTLCTGALLADTSGNQPHGTAGGTCTLTQQRTEQTQLINSLQTLVSGVNPSSANTRDLTNGSLANFIINGTGSTITTQSLDWVETAFKSLDNNNNVWFNVTNTVTATNDPNATEFAMLGMGVMLSSGKLTLTQINTDNTLGVGAGATAKGNILLAMGALITHTAGSTPTIPVTYTNMYLMNTTARVLTDQALISQGWGSAVFDTAGDDAATDLPNAEAQIVTWLNEVQAHGVHEFDSPTYSGTQFESLVEGYRLASDSNVKADYKTALDYLWLDLAANFFPGNIRIGGPFARDYDFRAGQGALQPWIEVVGCWTTGDATTGATYPGTALLSPQGINLEHAELLDIVSDATGYQLQNSTYALAVTHGSTTTMPPTPLQRSNYQTWGTPTNGTNPSPAPIRANAVFDNVQIGCTSGNYGPQDKLFAAALKGSTSSGKTNRSLALVSNVLDSSGNPYGTTTSLDHDGEAKPEHLQENMGCAYSTGAALLTMFVDPNQRDSTDNGLSTNILFPFDTAYSGLGLTPPVTNASYPTVAVDGVPVATMLTNGTCSAHATAHVILCPLTMNHSVVTYTGANGGGVIGVKFAESNWTDSNMNYTTLLGSTYQLEIDQNGSVANPAGGSNAASRIVVTHTNIPLSSEPGSSLPLPTFRIGAIVVTGDADTTPTRVLGILQNASYHDDNVSGSSPAQRAVKVTFATGYQPTDTLGNLLSTLQVVRSTATLTDTGVPTDIIGTNPSTSTWPAPPGCSTALIGIDGTGAVTCYATTFWSTHSILAP